MFAVLKERRYFFVFINLTINVKIILVVILSDL